EPQVTPPKEQEKSEFALPTERKPLQLLQETERSLRIQTVETLAPILPASVANSLQQASEIADTSLEELAAIDFDNISDLELRPARIFVGLTFAGFSALAILLLLIYTFAIAPELSTSERIHDYWYQYVFFVSFGIAGMFVLGREAMRDQQQKYHNSDDI
ncbi:MAG TPA: hypothetical protein VIQ31_22075, partial [Phormidium sp.]